MISDQNLQEYLQQLLAMERKMEGLYGTLSVAVKTNPYHEIFDQLMKEEHGHALFVTEMIKIFKLPEENAQ